VQFDITKGPQRLQARNVQHSLSARSERRLHQDRLLKFRLHFWLRDFRKIKKRVNL
jgi:hypothetical protein